MEVKQNEIILWINHGPIYFLSLFFGITPFKYNRNAMGKGKTAFTPCKWRIFWCYMLFALNLYTGSDVIRTTVSAFLTYESCFDEICGINICRNVCAHLSILWMNYIANFVSNFSILYLRRSKTLDCLNGAYILLKSRIYSLDFTLASWSAIFFLIVNWSAFFFHWRNSKFDFMFIPMYLPLYVMQSLPTITVNMVSDILLVIEHSFRDINRHIEEFTDKRFFLKTINCKDTSEIIASSIRYLKEYYWKCADLSDQISDCFNLDFLVVGFCTSIRFIYFLFLSLKYAAEKSVINENGGFVWPQEEAVVFFLAVVGNFYYLCYRCDCVVSEAEKIVPNLFTWRNRLRLTIDTNSKEQVDEFLNFINCRMISFDACSFFTLNLRLVCSIFGVTISYFIVLLQFQASHST